MSVLVGLLLHFSLEWIHSLKRIILSFKFQIYKKANMRGIFNLLVLTTFCFNVISGNSILQELSKLNQYSQVRFS